MWRATERKFLPTAGGLLDQPEEILQAWLDLDGLYDQTKASIKQEQSEHLSE